MKVNLLTLQRWLQSLFLFLTLSFGEECHKQSSCSCQVPGLTIDLKSLGPLQSPVTQSNYTYYYSPCTEQQCPGFSDTAICQCAGKTKGICYQVGTQSSAKFTGDPHNGYITISFDSASLVGAPSRKASIQVQCDRSASKPLFEGDETATKQTYDFTLKTDKACFPQAGGSSTKGLSTGSVLLIIFFVFLLIYVIGGILFLKFGRKAEGVEMIPNYEFWKELPSLIRDGVMFVFRGCKSDTTYSQI